MSARLATEKPISIKDQLPPKTGRRYIVVGGGGFLGTWIARQLLERGEDHKRVRLLDLNPPHNYAIKDALLGGVQFIKIDVADPVSLKAGFNAPWDDRHLIRDGEPEPEITVFHTAANIRFYERHTMFLDRSTRVNVAGTQNVIDAARSVGATVLIYTSSGSVGVRDTRLLLWPWESEPKHFVQLIDGDDERCIPKRHEDFFSNYAASKWEAEKLVRGADKLPTGTTENGRVLRTGCIRPGNGIFGPGGDFLCGYYLSKGGVPNWNGNVMQSFSYVENCACAHLCYEQRLIELQSPSQIKKNPDIGGQAFYISDPGPIPTYGDVFTVLSTLCDGECHFPSMSPTVMLIFAHLIEGYYILRHTLITSTWSLSRLIAHKLLPPVQGDLLTFQPSLFTLTSVHMIFDDSRARLSPEKGGLGFKGAWTTLEGVYKTCDEHKSSMGRSNARIKGWIEGEGDGSGKWEPIKGR